MIPPKKNEWQYWINRSSEEWIAVASKTYTKIDDHQATPQEHHWASGGVDFSI